MTKFKLFISMLIVGAMVSACHTPPHTPELPTPTPKNQSPSTTPNVSRPTTPVKK